MSTLQIRIPCRCGVLVLVDYYHGQRVICATCQKKEKG